MIREIYNFHSLFYNLNIKILSIIMNNNKKYTIKIECKKTNKLNIKNIIQYMIKFKNLKINKIYGNKYLITFDKN